MPHSANTLRLREIMRENSLTPLDVAEILNRSYQTVLIWRSVNDQDIPDNLLRLLELHIKTGREKTA